MVSTLSHLIYGFIAAKTFNFDIIPFLIFTNILDLDFFFNLKDKLGHREYLHNIFSFLFFFLIGFFFFDYKLVLTALSLHLILDAIDYKVPLFYPFSRKYYGLYLFKLKKKSILGCAFVDNNTYFTIASIIIFIVFLLFVYVI